MTNLIKFFAFAKSTSSTPIYFICKQYQIEDQLKIQATKVLGQLKLFNIEIQQRQKINTGNGSWYGKKDKQQVIYIILCTPQYSQRHAFAAINNLRDHFSKLGHYQSQPDSSLKMNAKTFMKELIQKYNAKSIDKIGQIQQNLIDIRSSVSDSTRKMISNQIQLQTLDRKSQSLKENAHQFSNNAEDLERVMYWRNCKLKILIGVIIVAIVCFIVIPIATK